MSKVEIPLERGTKLVIFDNNNDGDFHRADDNVAYEGANDTRGLITDQARINAAIRLEFGDGVGLDAFEGKKIESIRSFSEAKQNVATPGQLAFFEEKAATLQGLSQEIGIPVDQQIFTRARLQCWGFTITDLHNQGMAAIAVKDIAALVPVLSDLDALKAREDASISPENHELLGAKIDDHRQELLLKAQSAFAHSLVDSAGLIQALNEPLLDTYSYTTVLKHLDARPAEAIGGPDAAGLTALRDALKKCKAVELEWKQFRMDHRGENSKSGKKRDEFVARDDQFQASFKQALAAAEALRPAAFRDAVPLLRAALQDYNQAVSELGLEEQIDLKNQAGVYLALAEEAHGESAKE